MLSFLLPAILIHKTVEEIQRFLDAICLIHSIKEKHKIFLSSDNPIL